MSSPDPRVVSEVAGEVYAKVAEEVDVVSLSDHSSSRIPLMLGGLRRLRPRKLR